MTTPEVTVLLCSAPDRATAEHLATGLLERRLIACVNLIDQVTSVYRWEGKVETAQEVQLVIKTTAERAEAAQAWIVKNHPYDVPEVLALPVTAGHPAYLTWVSNETRG
ncbi:MAG: divalent-cation tolerance protein CutA [Myxococcales bacterium]|nr:divalent-cation tolerance protein CutA [Myxococcales bacterium]